MRQQRPGAGRRACGGMAWAMALLTGFAIGHAAAAVDLPEERRVPGGIAIIELGSSDAPPGEVFFNEHRAPVLRAERGWVAVIGIPLDTKPGTAFRAVAAHRGREPAAGPPESPKTDRKDT